MLLKCIRREGKKLGGGRFENNDQEEIEKVFKWSLSHVSREVAVLMWDYTGVIGYLCTLMLHN